MHTATIDKLFTQVINKKGIHKIVGRKLDSVLQLRYRHRHRGNITLETKLFYLQKAGIDLSKVAYTDADMLSFVRFFKRSSTSAKELGPEYLLEKWKKR